MTVYNELNKIAYIGSAEQTLYPIPFEYISTDDIKVSVYTSNNEFVEDWTYSIQYVIEDGNVKVLSGYNIDNTKKLLILRSVDLIQDNKYREGGDFPAKSTETSFDKLTMITQQLQETLDRCVKVDVLDIQTPEELLQTVYDKLDSATEIAGDAISAANQAQTAADNATAAVTSAEQTLVQTQAYVDSAKVEIDNTKNTAINTINSTVAQAKTDVNTAVDEATTNISDTSTSAVNTINSVKDSATSEINSAVSSAETEITSTKNTAINTINTAVSNAESNISTIVSDAEGSITSIAVTEANKAIANAAQEATDTATANLNSYVDGTVKPSLQTYVDQAQENANSAATSMEQAALSATAASNSASSASADADNAAESAGLAANSAASAATSKTNAKIWAEGTDSEVQALGGVHSSKGWSEAAQAVVNGKQDISNLSQTLDTSTTKYPSNKAVKTAIDAKDSLPSQSGQSGKFLTTNGTTASWADVGGGLEIGDVGFAPLGIDEAQNKRRYLNGQVISQSQFVSFTNKIKAAIALYPSLTTSETNWQAEVTNSKLGQCGKFVIDNTAGTIRLPKVVNINGLSDLALMGSIKAESLPNIRGKFATNRFDTWETLEQGAFYSTKDKVNFDDGSDKIYTTNSLNLDASRSSSTYQDNAPVQQEAVQYPYFIQVATGTEESVDVTREIELNNPFSLLDYKWSEYELNNASWLLSNGAFHSGATYSAVYELLLKIKNGTETKAGVSVKLSTEAYADTDFVINTANTTFRLPIKVKLASGNAVAGNGMSLGLTNGTTNYGLTTPGDAGARLTGTTSAYGSPVSTTGGGAAISQNNILGVTTDPTKSGIETSSSGLKLYFYVGETIQDANIIAASNVLTKVANGIDRTVKSDRELVVGWGTPDYKAGYAITSSETEKWISPSNGVVRCVAVTNEIVRIKVNDTLIAGNSAPAGTPDVSIWAIVCKGNAVNMYKNNGTAAQYQAFYPMRGG